MAVYTDAIQKLYVAYFNRPADYEGLAFWERVLVANKGDLTVVSRAFAASPEYKDQVAGKSFFQIVNQIYQNLFNRDADVQGLEFWAARLREGTFSVDQIVKVIADNASDTDAKDKTTYTNKVSAATAFTASLDTASEIIGYSGNTANAAAKNWLSTISTTASLNAAIAPAALATTVNAVSQAGLATGTPQALTVGIDALTGGTGNDTFNGLVNNVGGATGDLTTLTSLDSIVGGSGVDTLNINALTDVTSASLSSVSVSSLEIVNIRAAKAVTADISAWAGVEQFNVTEAVGNVDVAASATTNINANLKATGTSTTTVNGGKDIVVRLNDVAATTQDINVGQTTAAKGTVSVESVGKAAVAGTALTLGDINVKGGTTINVTQTATSSVAGLTVGTTTHTQGDIAIVGDASTTTVNVKQSAAATAVPGVATVAGTTETASVKFTALTDGQSVTVGGLTFTAGKSLTAAEVARAFANLVENMQPAAGDTQGSGLASNGTYTNLFATGWTSGAANGDTVVFTATEEGDVTDLVSTITPTITQGVDAQGEAAVAGVVAGKVTVNDAAGSIKTVTVDSYGGTGSGVTGTSTVLETLNLSNSKAGFAVADTAATLSLNLNKISSAAAINFAAAPTTLNVKSTGANSITLTAAATETLNVSGTGTLTAAATVGGLKTIKVTETAGLNLGASDLTTVTSVDTTGTTGTVTTVIAGQTATYAGGAGVDNVTIAASTTAVTKAINLGAGNDRLSLINLDATKLGNTGAAIVIEGGEGTDTLAVAAAAAASASLTPAFEGRFNGFERLEVGQLFGNTTVNLDNMDDINYVISTGSASAVAPTALAPTNTQGVAAVTESSVVSFGALAAGETYNVGGRTVTGAGAGATAAEVATAVATGVSSATVTVGGTLTGFTAGSASGSLVTFTSTTAGSNVTDIAVTGTGPATSTTTTQGVAAVTESSVIVFNALTAGQSYTVAGRTVTASGAATADQVAAAFISGTSAGTLAVSGALAGFTVGDNGNGSTADAIFTSTTAGSNVTDITTSNTGASGSTVLTLDKMLSGATVQLNAVGGVEVKLASTAGTADVVNFIANATTGSTIGTVTANGVETINVTANNTATSGVSTNSLTVAGNAATTINVTGAGDLGLTLAATTKIVTLIDGSAATGNLTIASSSEGDAVAVTIRGGAGDDTLTVTGNKADVLVGGAGEDKLVAGSGLATLTGGADNDLFVIGTPAANVNSYATITDFAAGDLIQFTGATSFASARVSLGDTAVFQDYANAAINALTSVGAVGWFQFQGNTYVVADMGSDGTEFQAGDFIVKLTGLVDLTNASFNNTYDTIGLI